MRSFTKVFWLFCLVGVFCLLLPQDCPAPLIWRKGQGWSYERNGTVVANNPKDQLDIGKKLQEDKKYSEAAAAYRRVIAIWPTSYSTQEARLGLAECFTELGYLYKGYKEYQNLIDKHPNSPHFELAVQREFDIATRFMNGEKHKVWIFHFLGGMEKAVEIFEQVVKNAPYGSVGPLAQFRIGLTFEKEKDNISAVHAYEKLLERYPRDPLAQDAQFQIGWAYKSEAQRADYDQNNANLAIAAFNDFLVRYPNSPRAEEAQRLRGELKQEQSKGLFQVAQFYEKRKNYKAAIIYFNEVIEQNPRSDWANRAQRKITMLAPRAKVEPPPPPLPAK